MAQKKQIRWYNIAFIAFTSVWGLNNVFNNFANQGLVVITSWVLIMALYFIPYTLMVGQLGSTFAHEGGGVSSWIRELTGPKVAYLASWTYWVVHIPYLAQKPQMIIVGFSWLFQGNGNLVKDVPALTLQILCLVIFLAFLWLASRGVTTISNFSSIAGIAAFTMSMLFIILGIAAPFMTHLTIQTAHMNELKTYIPKFDLNYFTTISMLVFAVGGSEKIAPYVNKTHNSGKEFPLGMICLAVMVTISAILGSFALGLIFNAHKIPSDLMANGAYYAFQILGKYFHVGNLFVWMYAITNVLGSAAAMAISIDAPLRTLLAEGSSQYIPRKLLHQNKRHVFSNGYIMTGVLVSLLIIIPALGIKGMNDLYNWLLNLNSVVTPMRYLWVFVAFMALSRKFKQYQAEYTFVQNKQLGFTLGLWCFLFTAFACLLGMIPKINYASDPHNWWFQLSLNIITPLVLLFLGLILPLIARHQDQSINE
ncbi:amino acid permease [Bombilactobacillus folatiphilus]|uniref:Amino acid permease n=1 Tax=Bombilactobacillus folatiphilus TaxID=2923362 RepID=A0ABY4P916_9LACO|nr:amino acid permease [Bombilactobacillus folatiphilus]UQS82110.1 amino acid permease [Bombilactobacillus folatiphilus]